MSRGGIEQIPPESSIISRAIDPVLEVTPLSPAGFRRWLSVGPASGNSGSVWIPDWPGCPRVTSSAPPPVLDLRDSSWAPPPARPVCWSPGRSSPRRWPPSPSPPLSPHPASPHWSEAPENCVRGYIVIIRNYMFAYTTDSSGRLPISGHVHCIPTLSADPTLSCIWWICGSNAGHDPIPNLFFKQIMVKLWLECRK